MVSLPQCHQMIDGVAVQQQIVSDDTAVTAPPDRFRTHQRQALASPKMDDFIEHRRKFVSQRIIGVVVKALHAPHRVDVFIDLRLLLPPSAQGWAVPVADLYLRKIVGQPIDVKDRVGA